MEDSKEYSYLYYIIGGLFLFFIALNLLSSKPKSDKDIYLKFYDEIYSNAVAFDGQYGPFIALVEEGKIGKAISMASNRKNGLYQLWCNINNIVVPKLKDEEVQGDLEKAKNLISTAYLNKYKALDEFLRFTEKPSPYVLANMKSSAESVQSQLINGLAYMVASGRKLGIPAEEMQERRRS